ncbi:MAG: hypothetical protein QOH24_2393 [Verrucomicrobiota bacterium]|jgi:hypothetical protein
MAAPAFNVGLSDLPPSQCYGATGRTDKHCALKENILKAPISTTS